MPGVFVIRTVAPQPSDSPVRVSKMAVEALATTIPAARVSKFAVEALATTDPAARVSKFAVEVLVTN